MTATQDIADARRALEQARSYQPINDFDRRMQAQNIDQIERYIAERNHPSRSQR